jgi:hypothetical protein
MRVSEYSAIYLYKQDLEVLKAILIKQRLLAFIYVDE